MTGFYLHDWKIDESNDCIDFEIRADRGKYNWVVTGCHGGEGSDGIDFDTVTMTVKGPTSVRQFGGEFVKKSEHALLDGIVAATSAIDDINVGTHEDYDDDTRYD